jgi:hypothetical protein
MGTVPGEPPDHHFRKGRATRRHFFERDNERTGPLRVPGRHGGRGAPGSANRRSLIGLLGAAAFIGTSIYAVTSGFGAPAAVAGSSTTVVLTPSADTFVTNLAPNSTGEPNTLIRLSARPPKNGYLRFAIPKLPTSPVGAVLHLYAQSAGPAGLAVHVVSNDSWSASTLTYRSAPSMATATLTSAGPIEAGTTVALNVLSAITPGQDLNLGLQTSLVANLDFGSSRSAHPPQLSITYPASSSPPSTSPPTTAPPSGVENTALTNSVKSGTNSNGWQESDTASISAADVSTAKGTVSYAVYSDNRCSVLIASAGTANVNNGSVPSSNAVNLKAGGTYYWRASYSGDPSNGASSTACTPLTEFMSSVDTMKESQDSHSLTCDAPSGSDVCSPTSQIGVIVAELATIGSRFITVDSQMDFPAYEAEWAATIHAAGKHVWWRVHPNFWEGDWGVTIPAVCTPKSQLQYRGVTPGSPQAGDGGSPCLEQYLSTESSWITQNSRMFEPGDVLDANPEAENSPYWDDNYGTGWTYEGNHVVAVPDFNQFLVDVTTTANTALTAAGINGVITGVRSLSESFAETGGALEQSTIDALGYLTMDSYPDQNFVPCNGGTGSCDPTYASDAASAWSTQLGDIVSDQQAARGNTHPVPILIGEAGYSNCDPTGGSNCAEITSQQKANVLADEYNAFESYDVQGLNYWVGAGQPGDGGNTQIMQPSGPSWSVQCGGSVLSAYFKSQSTTIATRSC